MLFGLLVFGVQVCRSAYDEKETSNADFRAVSSFARIQRYTDDKITTICEGNRSEVGSRRQCGFQAQLRVDLCIGIASVLLKCIIRCAEAMNEVWYLTKAPTLCFYPSGADLLRGSMIHVSALVN